MLDKITDALGSNVALGLMALLLVGLVGLMIFMRMKKADD